MADLKFTCSHCGQDIECDELWSGHQIECPTCKKELTVPPKPEAPPHANLASAKAGQPRLSIGQSRNDRSAAPPPPPPQMATLQQQLNQAKLAKKGNPMKWVIAGVAVIGFGVAGFFGYGYVSEMLAKRSEAAKQASIAATQQVATASSAEPAEPPPEKEPPAIPAIWTLDLDKARPAKGKVNGTISGTNFVAETIRLDKVGTTCLLRFLQGAPAAPDYGFMIYLRLNPGESVTGRTWTVTQDLKDKTVPQAVKVWKTNPRYAAKQKSFSSGYAMKLELGQIVNGVISGKIFLAVPDPEQSVIAGVFKADTSLSDASGVAAAPPAVTPGPGPMPGASVPGDRSAFDKRYGKKR